MDGNYLVTTDAWFYAPDGKKYRSVWGAISVLTDDVLGIKTNRISTNWFAKVGCEDKHIIIAGCQIHYAVKCDLKPHSGDVEEDSYSEKGSTTLTRQSEIYIAN